ncbi:unnamed protein product [Gongylonema pulchrum]|uniref:DUF4065 domain-containing protein n=1 Tax=Gongylonema pulchrum TaxID=637853 RepID=A0A183D3L2_9BILA|nr:unnamed protein product [Gongylonema pulchrum]
MEPGLFSSECSLIDKKCKFKRNRKRTMKFALAFTLAIEYFSYCLQYKKYSIAKITSKPPNWIKAGCGSMGSSDGKDLAYEIAAVLELLDAYASMRKAKADQGKPTEEACGVYDLGALLGMDDDALASCLRRIDGHRWTKKFEEVAVPTFAEFMAHFDLGHRALATSSRTSLKNK